MMFNGVHSPESAEPILEDVHLLFLVPMMACLFGCKAEDPEDGFRPRDGYYDPDIVLEDPECYDDVWDFSKSLTVDFTSEAQFELSVGDDNSGEYPGRLFYSPCILDGYRFDCVYDGAWYPVDDQCDGVAAEDTDIYDAQGIWTSSTSFDVTFTYRRAVLLLDGTQSSCPDLCSAEWSFTETYSSGW